MAPPAWWAGLRPGALVRASRGGEAPRLPWPGLNWPGLNWPGLNWPGLNWPGLNWSRLSWPGLGWCRLERSCAGRRRCGSTQARDWLRGDLNRLNPLHRLNRLHRGPVGRPWLRVGILARVAGPSSPGFVVTLAPRLGLVPGFARALADARTRRRDGRQGPFPRTRVVLRAARGGREGLVGRQVVPELVIRHAAEGLGRPHFLVDVGPLAEAHPAARPGRLGRVGRVGVTGQARRGPAAGPSATRLGFT